MDFDFSSEVFYAGKTVLILVYKPSCLVYANNRLRELLKVGAKVIRVLVYSDECIPVEGFNYTMTWGTALDHL